MPRSNDRKNRPGSDPEALGEADTSAEAQSSSGAKTPKGSRSVIPPATLGSMLEEAWHGWLKPVGGIFVVVVGYLAYDAKLLPEGPAGRVLVAIVLLGAIFGGIEPLLSRYTGRREQGMIAALALVWFVVAAGPVYPILFPGETLAQAELSGEKGQGTAELKMPDGTTGPYELEVGGTLQGTGEAEANYTIEVTGEGGTSKKVEGAIKRTYFRQRVSRRGNAAVSVRKEDSVTLYRLGDVKGSKLTINADIAGEKLESGVKVAVHHAGPHPLVFVALGLLVVLFGLFLDYRLVAPKMGHTYIAMWAGFSVAFAAYYRLSGDANPSNMVRPAVAAVLSALALGLAPVWVLTKIVNSFKPRPKKVVGATR